MTVPESIADHEIDWEHIRETLRAYLSGKLHGAERSLCEDLTQEALVRLLRALRREAPRSLDALAFEIARRTWTDHVRRARRWRVLMSAGSERIEETPDHRPSGIAFDGDPLARVELIVTEFFHARGGPCHELAIAWFRDLDWNAVARRSGLEPATVRQRWSRCMRTLREFARTSPDLLLAWVQFSEVAR